MWSFGIVNIIASFQFQSFNELKLVVLDAILKSFWSLLIQGIFLSSFDYSFKEANGYFSRLNTVFYSDFDEIEVIDGFFIVSLKEPKIA